MKTRPGFAFTPCFSGTFGRTMLATFSGNVRKNFAAYGTSFYFLFLEIFADAFVRTKPGVFIC